ncbi:hypothetical protein [Bacteroides sp. 519]|uniref:hypothetical protein n=1 Tax=Bacteroides sp. 519 TaxID=2302937 RepID=UPI0013D24074|nr:hypothetical protein [Bacteroides sp. 519]NDV60680.1 hypothetical protein [Bacteroides sp. 519]
MIEENYKDFIGRILNWMNSEEPLGEEAPECVGLSRSELEQKYPSYYIPYDASSGNLELTVDNGVISCLINNNRCTSAYFMSNDE